MTHQDCNVCGTNKPLGDFEKQRNRPAHRRTCKTCRYQMRDRAKERARHREYMRQRRINEPDAVRINWERSVYGVAKEDIGVKSCMVCRSVERLCIDHDHASGKVRGILCGKCNIAIGLFKDDPELMTRAAAYIKDGPHFELDRKAYP